MNEIIFPNIELETIKGVLIDIDNTLYLYETVHQKSLDVCYSFFLRQSKIEIPLNTFKKKYREKRNEVTARLRPHGSCRSRLFAFQEMLEQMHIVPAFYLALDLENLYWKTFLKNMRLAKDALHFLRKCKQQNILLCAVSDMQSHFQIQKLQALRLTHLIDYLVTSEEVGEEKPSAQIFLAALKKLNLQIADVIMIGDNIGKDIQGATSLGIRAYQIKIKQVQSPTKNSSP